MIDDELLCSARKDDRKLTVRETLIEALHHQIDDTADVVLRERLKHDDLIETVQELRTEV